jgi:c(7)-type cytochrome triheme protein
MRRFVLTGCAAGVSVALFAAGAFAVPSGVTLSWPAKTAGAVVFDGTVHADKGLTCDACHVGGMFQTRKDSTPINMEAIKKEQYCGSCHNGTKAFGTKDTKSCKRCHKSK